MHREKGWTLKEFEKLNKEQTSPEDAVKLYMQLNQYGKVIHEHTCVASSLKRGKTKLAVGILIKMYGKDKKWRELQAEMTKDIIDSRNSRGAGDKPVLQKYDPNYKLTDALDLGTGNNNHHEREREVDYSDLFDNTTSPQKAEV